MSILVNIHRTHRQHTDGRDQIKVEGRTVGECINSLTNRYPGISTALFDKSGGLRRHIEIYVNAESTYPDELIKTVSDGDEIHITMLLAGG